MAETPQAANVEKELLKRLMMVKIIKVFEEFVGQFAGTVDGELDKDTMIDTLTDTFAEALEDCAQTLKEV